MTKGFILDKRRNRGQSDDLSQRINFSYLIIELRKKFKIFRNGGLDRSSDRDLRRTPHRAPPEFSVWKLQAGGLQGGSPESPILYNLLAIKGVDACSWINPESADMAAAMPRKGFAPSLRDRRGGTLPEGPLSSELSYLSWYSGAGPPATDLPPSNPTALSLSLSFSLYRESVFWWCSSGEAGKAWTWGSCHGHLIPLPIMLHVDEDKGTSRIDAVWRFLRKSSGGRRPRSRPAGRFPATSSLLSSGGGKKQEKISSPCVLPMAPSPRGGGCRVSPSSEDHLAEDRQKSSEQGSIVCHDQSIE